MRDTSEDRGNQADYSIDSHLIDRLMLPQSKSGFEAI